MGVLRAALERATGGRGTFVLLSGDAGIGKSSVASAFAAEIEASGAAEASWGRAWEFAEAPPYFPLRPLLRARAIDPLAEEFREEGGSFRLWERVVEALAAAPRPLVWFIEDLHAADLLTLDLLTFLAQAVRGLRVLVVGTTRAKDPRLDDRAVARLTRIARDGIDLRLAPLTETEVGAVAARVCRKKLDRGEIARLTELTGGNPLFVVECARAHQGGSANAIDQLPSTVTRVVLDRFAQLSPATQRMLASGAVIGREFTAAVVGRMLSLLPAQVIDDVLPALRAGLVLEAQPGRFVFAHAIVRDVVEESLSAAERARLHARAEGALAGGAEPTDVAVERARHALEASALGDAGRALELARSASDRLEQEGSADRAWGVWKRIVDGGAFADVAALLETEDWLRYARIALAAGKHVESRRACERVFERARSAADGGTFARSALVAGANIRPAVVDRALVTRLEEALSLLGDGDPALACRVEARLAAALQPHDDFMVPIVMARAAFERARGLGDELLLLEVLDVGAAALVDFAPVSERLALFEEILRRAAAAGDRVRMLRAYARSAMDQAHVGDFAAFSRTVDASLRLADELGHPRYRWRPLLLSSMRALANGDIAESERAIVEVGEMAALTDDPSLAASLAVHLHHRALVLHRASELRTIIDEMPRTFAVFGDAMTRAFQMIAYARLDEAAPIAATLRTLPASGRAAIAREVSIASLFAEAVALAGAEQDRRWLRAALVGHEGLDAVGGHMAVSYDGPVARGAALLDAALGDVPAARALLEGALARAEARGHRTWVAQLAYDLARLGDTSHAARAEALATELGIEGLAEKVLALGVPSVAPTASVAAKQKLSFVREGDVWRVTHAERTIRIRDSRGMQLLARLVEREDEEVHVLALASDEGGRSAGESSAGELVDERALREYRERAKELTSEIDDAERAGDLGRLERARRERELLEDEIGRAVGLGGRTRKAASATERARVNVQKRLKDAIGRVAEADAALGRLLERAIRTGTFCCYRP